MRQLIRIMSYRGLGQIRQHIQTLARLRRPHHRISGLLDPLGDVEDEAEVVLVPDGGQVKDDVVDKV